AATGVHPRLAVQQIGRAVLIPDKSPGDHFSHLSDQAGLLPNLGRPTLDVGVGRTTHLDVVVLTGDLVRANEPAGVHTIDLAQVAHQSNPPHLMASMINFA